MSAPVHPSAFTPQQAPVARRERRPVSLRGFAAFEDGSTSEILVRDLSYDGCGIEIPVELKPGQSIKLSVLRRGAVDAEVCWYSEGRAGLVFEPEPAAARQQRPRHAKRLSVAAEVSMRRLGKISYRVRMTDLSPSGCKIEFVEKPRVDELVMIKFEGLEALEAEVCWIEGYTAGLRFEHSIHPAVFDMVVARIKGMGAPH